MLDEIKVEIDDLEPEDKWLALISLFIEKGIITEVEVTNALQKKADSITEILHERIKDNPSRKRKVKRYFDNKRRFGQS